MNTAAPLLTPIQGFDAMIRFLEGYAPYFSQVRGILLELRYSAIYEDGPNTGDPRVWEDWLECIEAVMASKNRGAIN